jgi:hypothetical protein
MRKRVFGGKIYYYLRSTVDGKRKEIPLGGDFILALRNYADLNVIDAPHCTATFADVQKKYVTDAVPKLATSTARMYASDIKHLMASFQDAPLDQIKPMNIRMFLDDHADKPNTANRCKRLFSTMLNQARGLGYTNLPNPCVGIKGHALAKRTIYITDAMYAAVYAQGSASLRDAMDLAYLTGQRPAAPQGSASDRHRRAADEHEWKAADGASAAQSLRRGPQGGRQGNASPERSDRGIPLLRPARQGGGRHQRPARRPGGERSAGP